MQIGRFEVVRVLGQGAMGRVVLARDPSRGADVAIKLLLKADSGEARARFVREERLLASLGEKEGFVAILESGESQGRPYLVMPFLTGGTLRERFARGPMPPAAAVALLRAIAAAVGRAHALGIVHRDLKPENVLFTAAGEPLVADLGLAKHFLGAAPGASQSVSLTQAGELRGTAGYMAPEQMRDAKSAGPPADVFALGALLHEAISGEPAFRGETALDVIGKVEAGAYTPLAALRPETPPAVAAAVARALARTPGERFPDAAAFARALEARGEQARPSRRGRVLVPIGLAAGVAAFLLLRKEPPTAPGPIAPPRSTAAAVASPVSAFPTECKGFLASPRTQLQEVFGSYALKLPEPVTGVAVSPDGLRGLTGDRLGRLWLWDLATFRVVRVLSGERPPVAGAESARTFSPVFLPDGKRAVSGSEDGCLRVWDLESGAALATLPAGQGWVYSIAVSVDGKVAATGGSDGSVHFWDLDALRATTTLASVGGGLVKTLSFSRNGEILLGACERRLSIWDVPGGREARQITLLGASAGALSADGTRALIARNNDAVLRLLDIDTMEELRTFTGHRGEITRVAFAPGERRALTSSADGSLKLWDLSSGGVLRSFDGHRDRVNDAGFSGDGTRILSGSQDQQAILWDTATGKDLRGPVGPGGPVPAIALARSGRVLLAGGADHLLRLLDATNGKLVRTIGSHDDRITATVFSGDGKSALSGSADGVLKLWDTATGRERFAIKAHEGPTRSAVFIDATTVASGGDDGKVSTWDGRGVERMKCALGSPVTGLAATTEVLLVGCDTRDRQEPHSLVLIDLATGILERKPSRTSNPITCLAISAAGHTVVTGGVLGSIRAWDVRTRSGQKAFEAHRGAVTGVAAGTDFFVSAGVDGTIRLTGLKGEELDRVSLATADDHVLSLALAQDERSFVAGTARGVVLRFELRRP